MMEAVWLLFIQPVSATSDQHWLAAGDRQVKDAVGEQEHRLTASLSSSGNCSRHACLSINTVDCIKLRL